MFETAVVELILAYGGSFNIDSSNARVTRERERDGVGYSYVSLLLDLASDIGMNYSNAARADP